MSETLTKVIVDCSTNTTQTLPLSEEEITNLNNMRLEEEQKEQERQTNLLALQALKTSAKNKLIAGQPLTAEEANLIVI